MAELYENMSKYNEDLRKGFEDINNGETTTVSDLNISGAKNTCNLTFKIALEANLDFLLMPNSPSPLNFKLFNKTEEIGIVISEINDLIVKQIEDLNCCGLSKTYNDSILPLFMYVVGDAGTPGSLNYGEWRKDDGFIPIVIKTIRELLKSYEIMKNVFCVMRPVPGNPWLKAGGIDFMKPVYGPLKVLEGIINNLLDGDYLDIILVNIKSFRDSLQMCGGSRIAGKLSFVEQEPLTVDPNILNAIVNKSLLDYQVKDIPIPIKPDKYYELDQTIKDDYSLMAKRLTEYNLIESEARPSKLLLGTLINTRDEKLQLLLDINYQQQSSELDTTNELYAQLEAEKVDLEVLIDGLDISIKDLEKTIEDTYGGKLKSILNEIDTIIIRLEKNEDEKVVLFNKYLTEKKVYDAINGKREKLLKVLTNCSLTSSVLAGQRLLNTGACACLTELLGLFIPVPEIVPIETLNDLNYLYGRLPFTIEEIRNYSNKNYDVITENNLRTKFKGPISFFYVDPYFIVPRTTYFKKIEAGIIVNDESQPVIKYIESFKETKDLKESINITNLIKVKRKEYFKEKMEYEKLVTEAFFNAKIFLTEERNKVLKNLNSTKSISKILEDLTAYNQNHQKLLELDDLLANPDYDYYSKYMDSPNSNSNIRALLIGSFYMVHDETIMKIEVCNQNIELCNNLITANTRFVTIISKEKIPCDCDIICKILQYFINMLMKAMNNIINAIIKNLIDGLMTKEIAYIIKFLRAKLQCALDIIAIPDNIERIGNRANEAIEHMQNIIQKMEEPIFCNNDENSEPNENLILSPQTEEELKLKLLNYNFSNNDAGEINNIDFNKDNEDSTPILFPYPNTTSSVNSTYINPVQLNNNSLIINNVKVGEQFEFRNIPTLEFDCNVQEEYLPVFDIYTETKPDTWSLYFSFELNDEKLASLENELIIKEIKNEEKIIDDILLELYNKTTADVPTNLIYDIDLDEMINKAKAVIDSNTMEEAVENCTPDEIKDSGTMTACSFLDLKLINISKLPGTRFNNINYNISVNPFLFDASIINTSTEPYKFKVPFKVTVQKIYEELGPEDPLYYSVDDSKKEEVSVILLLDIYRGNDSTIHPYEYNSLAEYDPYVLFGRYPIYEIGYKDLDTNLFYLDDSTTGTAIVSEEKLLEIVAKAITVKASFDIDSYKPTEEEIEKQKEKLQEDPTPECKQAENGLTPEVNSILINNKKLIEEKIIPTLEDIKTKFDKVINIELPENTNINLDDIKKNIVTNTTQVPFGIPLIELNGEKDICLQIIKVNIGTDIDPDYKYRLNISNFNFISNFLKLSLDNFLDTLMMDIEAKQTYFISIVFNGTSYNFTVIDENKNIVKLSKINTETLFPTRFGRLSNPSLKDNTFCGRLFDLGIANTIIDPELYYKFSMLNFKPKTNLFINFENFVFNNFYSNSELGIANLEKQVLDDTVKQHLEKLFLKNNESQKIPYFIYNKYITSHPMYDNIELYNNRFITVSRNNYFSNFFCKESIKDQSFTISFWIKRQLDLDKLNMNINPEREILISDTKFFNNLFYNSITNKLIFEINNKKIIETFNYSLDLGIWYNIILKFNHLTNNLEIVVGSERDDVLTTLPVLISNTKFNFNLISLFSEFNFISKKFESFMVCDAGHLIIQMEDIKKEILNKYFKQQKLCFKGC